MINGDFRMINGRNMLILYDFMMIDGDFNGDELENHGM